MKQFEFALNIRRTFKIVSSAFKGFKMVFTLDPMDWLTGIPTSMQGDVV